MPTPLSLPEGTDSTRLDTLEKVGVRASCENMITFLFVAKMMKRGELTLHGLWNDVGQVRLECHDAEAGGLVVI